MLTTDHTSATNSQSPEIAQDAPQPPDSAAPAQLDYTATNRLSPAAGGRWWVLAILAFYFVLSTLYNLAVPVGEAPDEPSHVDFVQTVLRTGQLPTIPVGSARYSYEAEQPPLYYLLQAGWMGAIWPNSNLLPHLVGNPDFSFAKETPYNVYLHTYPAQDAVPVHLMRFLSTLLGLFTLVLIWLAAREIWPAESGPALIALGFAALLPGFTFTSGTVTNDTLAAVAGAAFIYLVSCAFRRGLDWRIASLSGVVLGLGILSKRSLLVFIPLMLLAFLLAPTRAGRNRFASMGIALAGALAVGIWPFVGNMVEYGDPFATAVTQAAKGQIASPLANMPLFWLNRGYIGGLLDSLWGVFGLRNMELPGAVYLVYYLLLLVGLLFSVFYLRRASRSDRSIMLVLGVALALVYAGVAYQNSEFWAVQGRLLLPGLAALSLLVGRGISTFFATTLKSPRAQQLAIAALLMLLLALNIYALVGRLIPAYYG